MGKRKRPDDLSSSETHKNLAQLRREAKRHAVFIFTENEAADGKKTVSVYCFDSQIRKEGRADALDHIYFLAKDSIYFHLEDFFENFNLMPELESAAEKTRLKYLSPADTVKHKLHEKNKELRDAEKKLEAVRKLVMRIKTGKGGTVEKSDPYDLKIQLSNILNGVFK